MLYFHDWPDVTIHTSKDQPENLDATKLGRVTYLGAGIAYTLAALPESEAPKLLALARAGAEKNLAEARLRQSLSGDAREGALAVRESIAQTEAKLASIARRWPATATAVREASARMKAETAVGPATAGGDPRVPVRNPDIRGPLGVYYYDHFSEALAAKGVAEASLPAVPALKTGNAEVLEYEALNLADGKRSISEIRDLLSGRYAPVPLAFVAAHFERWARAGIVTLK